MYFIQHLLLNLKLIQQISQRLSYITFITKFNCPFKNIVNTKVLDDNNNNNNNNNNNIWNIYPGKPFSTKYCYQRGPADWELKTDSKIK